MHLSLASRLTQCCDISTGPERRDLHGDLDVYKRQLVSFVLGATPDELVMTSADADVVQLFTAQGMMPRLKFQHRTTSLEPAEGARSTE